MGRTPRPVPVSHRLQLTQDPEADALLSRDPFALLVGMLLDQQIPMERAFLGPARLADRLGTPGQLDPVQIAACDAEEFAELMATAPAVHRFPGAMAGRVQALARAIVSDYDGRAQELWESAATGKELVDRLKALPGFGDQKARIFAALLGKQLLVRPRGWRSATEPYGQARTFRSVADVVDEGSLLKVREAKQEAKRVAKGR